MSVGPFGKGSNLPHGTPGRPSGQRRVLGNVILVLAVSIVLASITPAEIRAAAVASFLFFVSIGVALSAMLRREHAFVNRITRWDLAALFYLCSIGLHAFVDEEAVRALVEQAQQSQQSLFSPPSEDASPAR